MRNVIFVAPFSLETTMRFVRAVSQVPNVRLLGILQGKPSGVGAELYHDVEIVPDAMDATQIFAAAKRLRARHGEIHRLLGILEPLQVPLAQVREALGIKGVGVKTAELFRDKGLMKDALRKAGLPCARHAVLTSQEDAARFASEVGFPVVLKPPAGMGCKATWRVNDASELRQAVSAIGASPSRPALAEEFLRGREYSYETFTLGGVVQFRTLSRYYPTPLEVMETPWLQWAVVLPKEITGAEFDGVHELGERVVTSLGLDTGMTHMEWFRKADGSLAVGEIAARPPGAQIVLANSFAYDTDMYYHWARVVIDGVFEGPLERKYAVGTAFLRGVGRGRVVEVAGIAEAQQKVGRLVVRASLPDRGTPRSDSYEGEGYVMVRHEDTEVVKDAVKVLLETIRIRYA